MIDTLRTVQTPEGIEPYLPVAGLIPHTLAWMACCCYLVTLGKDHKRSQESQLQQ